MNGLEALKSIRPCANVCGDYDPYCNTIEKELKALEIIKKKLVSVSEVLMTAGVEYYNNGYSEEFHLTQDEYDLIKEVMK